MTVIKKILLDDSVSAMNATTAYVSSSENSLLQHYIRLEVSDTMGEYSRRYSHDNGRTWSASSLLFKPYKTDKGVFRRGENALFLDREKSAVIHVYNLHIYPDNVFSGEMYRHTRIFFEISFDGGKNFCAPRQIIQDGYDEVNWAEGIYWGKNQSMLSFSEIIKTNGCLILPAQRMPLDADFAKPYRMALEAGCFIGRWKGDSISWNCAKWRTIEKERSVRGVYEPAIAELRDGGMIMVCRASSTGNLEMPSFKWCSFSDDGGLAWTSPEPLKYDDGVPAFSPSSGSKFIRSSQNGKLYWIGNLSDQNPEGSRPRYPLLISEFDEDKKALKRESIKVFDTRNENDSPLVQLSNFKVYEDRETHEFVLNMARLQERGNISGNPLYEYRMKI
jgi:hypothetical protein